VSQYQQPYQPPQPPYFSNDFYAGYSDPRSPARRAAILMFVIGALMLCCGGFFALFGAILTPEMLAGSPQAAQLQEIESQLGVSIKVFAFVMAGVMFVPALLFIGLGFWVRRGSAAAAIVSLVLTGLTVLFLLFNLVGSLVRGGPGANVVLGVCMIGIALALCSLLIAWLIGALRAAPQVAAMQQQYQMQYWQSQQTPPPSYGAGGYGYGTPAPQFSPPPSPQPPNQGSSENS